MSTSWDPYGSGGNVVPTSANPSGPISSHNHHLHSPHLYHHMTSSTAAASSSPSSIYSHAGNNNNTSSSGMPPGTSTVISHNSPPTQPPIRGHAVTTPQQNYTHPSYPPAPGGYVPHLGTLGQPHGSPHVPPYSGTPVIHPYPPPSSVTTASQSTSPYHHPLALAPVPPLPGTAPLPPPLGVPPYNPSPYSQPAHHIPLTTQPLTTQPYTAPHASHSVLGSHPINPQPQPQPYNLKVTAAGSPQPISAPLTPTPVPQTPVGGPPAAPFSNGPPGGPEHDLPPELLSSGWRKFWSKRENRWYFWNCNTGESLWEFPPTVGRYPPQPGVVSSTNSTSTETIELNCLVEFLLA